MIIVLFWCDNSWNKMVDISLKLLPTIFYI